MKKQEISNLLRSLGLSKIADYGRFYYMYLKNYSKNKKFIKQYQNTPLPPAYLMYESFQMDYSKYLVGGKEDAIWVTETVSQYMALNSISILDWGCGPGRIVRHLPEILGPKNNYFATDYNPSTIAWCKENLQGIIFSVNQLQPPLNFTDGKFEFVYGISILTHLSEENQILWSNELYRISASEGLVLLTTHGEAFNEILLSEELQTFKEGKVVIRANVDEGHRVYAAFHPPSYMRDVFTKSGFQVLLHTAGRRIHNTYISQDVWLLRKE